MLLLLIAVSSIPCFYDVSCGKSIGQSCLEARSMMISILALERNKLLENQPLYCNEQQLHNQYFI